VGIVGDDQKQVRLGAQDLVAEGLVVDVAGKVGLEVEDEFHSVCKN
jgi:hypothetical protein